MIYLTLLAMLLLIGFSSYAHAQSTTVVINEIELNPPGDDSKSISEWVELYNPTESEIKLDSWSISSTTLKKSLIIPPNTTIAAGKFLTFSYTNLWFADSGDVVEIRDANGLVIDKSPFISDQKNDYTSWQRVYDGVDSDSPQDWKFVSSTAGSSNGKIQQGKSSQTTEVTISSNKSSYIFGETAVIEGSISKQLFSVKPSFQPEQILVSVSGPDYNKTISLYPDLNLNFKTSLNLQKVLGIKEGLYAVSIKYGDSTSKTSFLVTNEIIFEELSSPGELSLSTDNSQYIPGNTLVLSGVTSEVVPYEGLKFSITDPNGKTIYSGNLFPTNGKFFTKIYLTTVNPVFGTFKISANYSTESRVIFFELVPDIKEDKIISLSTNKEVYGLGETVTITGRLNKVWVNTLDLEIIQTRNSALTSTALGGSNTGFKILDVVRISGDGSFTYSFQIPENNSRLGDYRINVSKEIGSASKVIQAISDPDGYVPDTSPLSLSTDKVVYEMGDKMTIKGIIATPVSRSSFETSPVTITISREDGSSLSIVALPPNAKTRQDKGITVAYEFTAIPDYSGRFSVQTALSRTIFSEGTYLIKAEYEGRTQSTIVGIVDPLKLEGGMFLTLNKQVFGLGETVTMSGLTPPSGDRSVAIDLTRPDGTMATFGATVENQRFSWSWNTPTTEKPAAIKDDGRSITKSNYGLYKIKVSASSTSKDLFFKVSATPENDSLSLNPIFISSEKSLYKAGEKLKISGTVIQRTQGSQGLVIPERVLISIIDPKSPNKEIYESAIYPDFAGNFKSQFDLPLTIFKEGEYKVKALYSNKRAETSFSVVNDVSFGSTEKTKLLLDTDKKVYYPGESVTISGKPNKLIYLEKFDVSIIKKTGDEITCGSFFCGKHLGKVTTIRPSTTGQFSHQITIPNDKSGVGEYEVTVDADFDTQSIRFDVLPQPEIVPPIISPFSFIEKSTRIPDKEILIIAKGKMMDGLELKPRVISGTLLTPLNLQSTMNLKVISESGVCIIGQEENCLVKQSTREPGKIYDVVTVDGINLNVRYSGPDVRLEKFDILPELSDSLPPATWNVEIIKEDDQSSRFYTKVNYKEL